MRRVSTMEEGAATAMVMAIVIGVVVLLIAAILAVIVGKDRYAEMTDAEFEAEAKEKSSLIGTGMMGLEKAINPKKFEYMQQLKEKKQTDAAGDLPPDEDNGQRGHGS